LGYDAYSVLKTGKDHHGTAFPLVAFESFGDWKPSLYFYTTALVEALFGLNVFAVRLSSALSGIGSVLLCYLIAKTIFKNKARASWIAFSSGLLLALSPWHLLISRVGFETNLAFFLSTLGLYLFLNFINSDKKINIVLMGAMLSWGLSLYAYHSNRMFIPLLIFSLCIWFNKEVRASVKPFLGSSLLFVLITLPIFLQLNNPQVRQRFAETSALNSLEPILASNAAIEKAGNTRFAKIIYHRYRYYGKIILNNYLSHFNFNYLFVTGDGNRRHSTGMNGQLLIIYLPLVLIGLIGVLKNRDKQFVPVFIFTLLAPLPSAITISTPHALRSLPMVLGLSLLAGYGWYILTYQFSQLKLVKRGIMGIIFIILIIDFFQFWRYYQTDYRTEYASQWQYGYQELMSYVNQVQDKYDSIVISRELGRPAMFYWFFNQIDPVAVQAWNNISLKDQGEYLVFKNLYFGVEPEEAGKQLRVSTIAGDGLKLVREIKDLQQNKVFYLYEN